MYADTSRQLAIDTNDFYECADALERALFAYAFRSPREISSGTKDDLRVYIIYNTKFSYAVQTTEAIARLGGFSGPDLIGMRHEDQRERECRYWDKCVTRGHVLRIYRHDEE